MTNRRIRTGRDDAIVFGDLRYPKVITSSLCLSQIIFIFSPPPPCAYNE